MSQIIKKDGDCTRFEIRNNKVREVEKFNNSDEGVTSDGFDSFGNEVFIKNLDSGKSKELMRVVLEGDYIEQSSRKILIIGILVSAIIFGIIYIMFFGQDKSIPNNERDNIILNTTPVVGSNDDIESENIQKESDIPEVAKESKYEEKFEIQSLKLENSRLSYSYEDLQSEYKKSLNELSFIRAEKNEISQENKDLRQNIIEYEKKIAELELFNIKNSKTPKNFDSNEFICFLGNEVYQRCEKAESEGEKNACKDIYYNFIK